VDNGLPVTRVISRVTLQQKLAEAAKRYGGESIIQNDCHVVDFEEVLSSTGINPSRAVVAVSRFMLRLTPASFPPQSHFQQRAAV
jgi:hypothetical protein